MVVVSPDTGGVKRAERFRQALERRLERPVGFAFLEKYRSEGVVSGGTVVGDVRDRVVVHPGRPDQQRLDARARGGIVP